MPFILSPIIQETFEGMWFEGSPFVKETIYNIHSTDPKSPPVNYSAYTLKPHSLPHIEGSAHTLKDGKTVDQYFTQESLRSFWGKTTLVKLKGHHFEDHPTLANIRVWEVSLSQLKQGIFEATGKNEIPSRLILTLENIPENKHGLHDQNYVLILSQEAADYLVSSPDFCLYGTSWKSSDFKPGSKERPIHNTLFQKAAIMECLDLKQVPSGIYFMNAFPLPLQGASESPVCPILYTQEELQNIF